MKVMSKNGHKPILRLSLFYAINRQILMVAKRQQETEGASDFIRHHLQRVVAISAVFRQGDRILTKSDWRSLGYIQWAGRDGSAQQHVHEQLTLGVGEKLMPRLMAQGKMAESEQWKELRQEIAEGHEELLRLLQSPRGRDGLFPELVLFDCHSCHHAMGDKRGTALRVGAGPGFVRLNDASLLMLRQIVARIAPSDAGVFKQHVFNLHKAVASGNDALAQARIVEDQITAMIPKISAHRFTGEDVKAIMIGLIDDGLNGQYTDYQGAEQAAMAVQSRRARDLATARVMAMVMMD